MFHRPKHSATTQKRGRKLTAASLALLIVAGIALAAFLVNKPIRGGGSINAPADVEFVAVEVSGTNGVIDCAASRVSQNQAEINLNNADAGSWCEVTFSCSPPAAA